MRTSAFILPLVFMISTQCEAYDLSTHAGPELGLTVSYYQYDEPSLEVRDKGTKFGADYSYIAKFNQDWFLKGDARFAIGLVDYSSRDTGTSDDNSDWYTELRLLSGHDYDVDGCDLSPYTGVGYRFLHNDSRGFSTTGHVGYRRESQYFYIPLGGTYRMYLGDTGRLSTTLEYDYFLFGQQKSFVSDVDSESGDGVNNQHSGYGLKASVMYDNGSWGIGPYAYYWNINKSDVEWESYFVDDEEWLFYFYEPANHTLEVGLKVFYLFA